MDTRLSLLPFMLVALCLSTGCFRQSEWTRGDDGSTQWQLYDGLCPAGGCDLDVPVAPDQDVSLTVKGVTTTSLRASVGDLRTTFTPSSDGTSADLQFHT